MSSINVSVIKDKLCSEYLKLLLLWPLYRKAAEKGVAKAQCDLGNCYYYGYGVEKDYTKAVEWYRKAAEQGFAEAQYKLGFMYSRGYGVEHDFAKAVEWYRKAAYQGHTLAQYKLGFLWSRGLLYLVSSKTTQKP